MRKYIIFLLLVVFWGNVRAEKINSCNGGYSARVVGRYEMLIEHAGQRVGAAKINHAIDGGVFSLDDSILVVFGPSIKIDAGYPQVTYLSVYSVKPKIHLVEKEVYGGGVYDAAFSSDQKFIVVDNQFGVDVINLGKRKAQSFDSAYVPQFKTQQCEKK